MKNEWMLSETVRAEEGHNILMIGDNGSVCSNVIQNLLNMENFSAIIFDYGNRIYDSTNKELKDKDFNIFHYDYYDPTSDSINVQEVIKGSGFSHLMADAFYYNEDMENPFNLTESYFMYCASWVNVCNNGTFEDLHLLISSMIPCEPKEIRFKKFYDYEEANNGYSPITYCFNRILECSDETLTYIITAALIRVEELLTKRGKELTGHGTLGLDKIKEEPTVLYVNNARQESILDHMIYFTIMTDLENQYLNWISKKDKNIPLFVITNNTKGTLKLPWKQYREITDNTFLTKVTCINSIYDMENNAKIYDYMQPGDYGCWVAMDVYKEEDAEYLSDCGGWIFKQRKTGILKKDGVQYVPKVTYDKILNMGKLCYIRKEIGISEDDISLIDNRFEVQKQNDRS